MTIGIYTCTLTRAQSTRDRAEKNSSYVHIYLFIAIPLIKLARGRGSRESVFPSSLEFASKDHRSSPSAIHNTRGTAMYTCVAKRITHERIRKLECRWKTLFLRYFERWMKKKVVVSEFTGYRALDIQVMGERNATRLRFALSRNMQREFGVPLTLELAWISPRNLPRLFSRVDFFFSVYGHGWKAEREFRFRRLFLLETGSVYSTRWGVVLINARS